MANVTVFIKSNLDLKFSLLQVEHFAALFDRTALGPTPILRARTHLDTRHETGWFIFVLVLNFISILYVLV